MKIRYFVIVSLFVITFPSLAQVGISDTGYFTPDPSALLHLNSQTKGLVVPRVTTAQQRDISEPAIGLVIFNLDSLDFYFFTGTCWKSIRDTNQIIEKWNCGSPIAYEGLTYQTVVVDTQCWLARNLNVGTRIDKSVLSADNGTIEKYCYQDQESVCDAFGGLYTWYEAMNYSDLPGCRGICPLGWHLPTDNEWKVLEGNADSNYPVGDPEWDKIGLRGYDAGKNLKSTSGWREGINTDIYGFDALPCGYLANGSFSGIGDIGSYRTSSSYSDTWSWTRLIAYYDGMTNQHNWHKNFALSVRCIRDLPVNRPPDTSFSPDPPDESLNIMVNPLLTWQCDDPDNDPLSFDIYFDTVSPPALRQQGLSLASYSPGILKHGETYYWQVIAIDDNLLTTEGPVWNFSTIPAADTCLGIGALSYGGNEYTTVQIGIQCWLAQNLNIGEQVIISTNMQNNSIIEKYCFNDEAANCAIYGGLYQFNEAMQYIMEPGTRGICPEGWHIPSDLDWVALEGFVDSLNGPENPIWFYPDWRGYDAGANLKSSTGWNGTDQFGFSALPAGMCEEGGSYLGSYTFFWTSNSLTSGALARLLRSEDGKTGRLGEFTTYGFSVRCIKDN